MQATATQDEVRIGPFVRQLRQRRRWTLQEVSKKTGLSSGYLSSLETERHPRTGEPIKPDPDTLKKLATAFEVPLLDLMTVAGHIGPNLRVVETEATPRKVPYYGKVGCGEPVDLTGDPLDFLTFDSFSVRFGEVIVQATGDSMDRQGIVDGAYLVVQPTDNAPSGKIVIANLDGLGCTCKRLTVRHGKGGRPQYWLFPESTNPEHQPALMGPNDRIVGIVKRQIREY